MIRIKRIYEPIEESDGFRILVDRLWPRGISKEKAHLDLWFRDVSPSNELRKWYNHDPEKWEEFRKRYVHELEQQREHLDEFKTLVRRHKIITLLTVSRVADINHAAVLMGCVKDVH